MRVFYGFLLTLIWSLPASVQAPARMRLGDVVAEAAAKNPEIAAAQRRYDAATERPAQERSLPDPMVSAGDNASGSPLPGAGLGSEPTANIGSMVSQELPYPGKRDLRASIASREADAEFPQIEAARLNITARVKQAYYNGTTLRLYINGVLVKSSTVLNGNLAVSNGALRIGGNAISLPFGGQYFKGLIDEIRIDNRALSQSEIHTDMSGPLR